MIHHSYRFGMRQPSTRVRLGFAVPSRISFDQIDLWIKEALEFNISDYQPKYLANQPTGQVEEQYLIRLLCVTTILLQDIRVPVFEAAVIVSLEQETDHPDKYIADIWFPIVEALPIKVFHDWLLLAGELLIQFCKFANDQDSLRSYYDTFQNEHVLPWSKKIPGAKSTIPILEAAFELGIPFTHSGWGRYLLGWGSQSRIFHLSSNALDSAIGAANTHNKAIAIELMRLSGIPTPRGMTFMSGTDVSLESVNHLRLPLVVKPVDRDRGEGVTMQVRTEESFKLAVSNAVKLSKFFLVEEQVEGTCHRILIIKGKIIYVVKRNPKGVIGDGISSIQSLVEHLNTAIRKKIPQKRLPELPLDRLAINSLTDVGLSIHSVPKHGEKIFLRPAQSTQWGGDPEVVTENLHPDNADLAIRAARLFGLTCAGIDFITTDIATPWHLNNAVINEVNYAPVMGRTHHYQRQATRAYLEQLFPAKGLIATKLFLGVSSKRAAINEWKQQISFGKSCFFCSDHDLLRPDGQTLHLSGAKSIHDKIRMLRADVRVDALVIHTNNKDAFSDEGQPFEMGDFHERLRG